MTGNELAQILYPEGTASKLPLIIHQTAGTIYSVPRPKVYVAGKMTGLSWEEATSWRNELGVLLQDRFEILSPMRGQRKEDFYPGHIPAIEMNSSFEMTRDLTDIEHSDVIIARFGLNESVSFGTAVELGTCIPLRKPVVFILDKDDKLMRHPFIKAFPRGVVTHDLETAVRYLLSMFAL